MKCWMAQCQCPPFSRSQTRPTQSLALVLLPSVPTADTSTLRMVSYPTPPCSVHPDLVMWLTCWDVCAVMRVSVYIQWSLSVQFITSAAIKCINTSLLGAVVLTQTQATVVCVRCGRIFLLENVCRNIETFLL